MICNNVDISKEILCQIYISDDFESKSNEIKALQVFWQDYSIANLYFHQMWIMSE